MDRTRYTEELNDIIGFMETEVLDSFPSRKLSLEHLVVAILESPKSHAYMLLKSCTMSSALDKVKAIYTSYLSKNSHVMTAIKKNSADYDDGLTKVLTDAEGIKLPNDEGNIGSEHVLISLLQQESPYDKTSEAFKNIGVNHSFVKSRCSSNKERLQDKNRDKKQQGAKGISFNIVNGNMQPQQQDDFLAKYTATVDGCLSDDIVGRKEETELILRTLSKRSKKNVILVGNCGVGKTAIVYNIARLIKNNLVPSALKGCKVVRLNTSSLIGGTHFRGMLEERIDGVFKALEDSKKTILFIDDIQQVVKNSSKEKDSDISQQLGNALSNGRITVIATTNFKDYRNGIEKDPLLSRQFQKIIIEEPNIDECINILNNIKINYELYHNVNYDNNIINNIVKLSKKYITSRSLPDSAVDVLDLCGVYAKEKSSDNEELNRLTIALNEAEERKKAFISKGDFEKARDCELQYSSIKKQISTIERHSEGEKAKVSVTEEHVASTISTMTGIPINKLSVDEKERVGKIDEILKTFIKGQDEAIDKICKPIKRSKIGLCGRNRVISAQLLVGSSGVGKTLLAKKLAEEIYGSEKNLIRLDMSEYADKSSISKLLGSNPSYVGFENGGQLTEAIKNKPNSVLLLDEIEKADVDIFNVFLQMFDEGRLTDNSGQLVDCKNLIVLMTSNVGTRRSMELGGRIGFSDSEEDRKQSIIEKEIKNKFAPEFINRLDNIIFFNALDKETLKEITKIEIDKTKELISSIGYNFSYDDSVIDYITEKAYEEREFGARPIKRLLQTNIEDKITEMILSRNYEESYSFNATVEEGEISIS